MLALTLLVAAVLAASPASPCQVNRSQRLALDPHLFDQGQEGWRGLTTAAGCEIAAADLIAEYRAANGAKVSASQRRVMLFHEGQLRATAGDVAKALTLIAEAAVGSASTEWRAYLAAIAAFLRRDREALLSARARLVGIPAPPWFANAEAGGAAHEEPLSWPPNLDVVDALVRCLGKTYREAHDATCRLNTAN